MRLSLAILNKRLNVVLFISALSLCLSINLLLQALSEYYSEPTEAAEPEPTTTDAGGTINFIPTTPNVIYMTTETEPPKPDPNTPERLKRIEKARAELSPPLSLVRAEVIVVAGLGESGVLGKWNNDTRTVALDPVVVDSDDLLYGTLAHELAHAICGGHSYDRPMDWTVCATAAGVPLEHAGDTVTTEKANIYNKAAETKAEVNNE